MERPWQQIGSDNNENNEDGGDLRNTAPESYASPHHIDSIAVVRRQIERVNTALPDQRRMKCWAKELKASIVRENR